MYQKSSTQRTIKWKLLNNIIEHTAPGEDKMAINRDTSGHCSYYLSQHHMHLLFKNKINWRVNLTVTNTATSSSESPLCNSPAIAPSCPSAYEMLANAPAEGLPPPYHSTVDIERLLAIPKPSRTASEIQAVIAHFEGKNTSPPPSLKQTSISPPASCNQQKKAGGPNNFIFPSASC